jgi:hypothetical protein
LGNGFNTWKLLITLAKAVYEEGQETGSKTAVDSFMKVRFWDADELSKAS